MTHSYATEAAWRRETALRKLRQALAEQQPYQRALEHAARHSGATVAQVEQWARDDWAAFS